MSLPTIVDVETDDYVLNYKLSVSIFNLLFSYVLILTYIKEKNEY